MRKLAAIMFTDVVGYTALAAKDEEKAYQLLSTQRELLKPIVNKYNGSWTKEIGDGLLLTFSTVTEAVRCAIEIQQATKEIEGYELRIGIHQGEIIEEEGDVFGDDVNVASRIEPFAAPGGIAISHKVQQDISSQPEFTTKYLGQPKLKGVKQDIKVHCITSHGLPETKLSEISAKLERRPGGWSRWAVPALLIIVAASYYLFFRPGPAIANSVAVLPFANLSDSKDDEYFSDGVTDDIITHLTKIGDLKVISRTSTILYKDSPKSSKTIAEELGVSNILEGTVRRLGDKVRITGQLIDADTDQHLWAETYDRDLTDIFAIQSDVARNIAAALNAILSLEERQRLDERPTVSTTAYDYYLRAYEYERRGNERKTLEIAIDLYKKAIAFDSSFAQAYAHLGLTQALLYWLGYDRTSQRLVMAREAVDQALSIKPDDPVVRVANGYYYYLGSRDYARALEEFYFAQRMEPGNGLHAENIAYIQRRLGKFEEAVTNFKTALEYDPRSSRLTGELGNTYWVLRRYDLAEQSLEKAIQLAPDNTYPYLDKALLQVEMVGNTESARQVLAEGMRFADPTQFSWTLVDFDIEDNRYNDALERLTAIPEDVQEEWVRFMPKEAYIGWIFELMEKPAEARRHYENARALLEEKVRERPDDPRIHAELGKVYARLGLADEAIREGRKAVDLLPVSLDALTGPGYLKDLAEVYTIVGEYDEALDILEHLLEIPGSTHIGVLRFRRVWDPLREHPRFQELLEQHREQ